MQARHHAQQGEIPHAVVRRAVLAGDPGAVEHDRHRQLVQCDVHQQLVERPVEEGGVEGDHRVHAAEGQPRRRGECMLLGDADVIGALGEAPGELADAGRLAHRRRDHHDVVALLAQTDEFLAEHTRPAAAGTRPGQPGERVEAAGLMHLVGLVVLGRRVAVALARDAVDDHRPAEAAGQAQRVLDGGDVVAVDRSEVLQAEILEHALRLQHVLDAALDAVQRVVDRLADHRGATEGALHLTEHPLVARLQPQAGQVLGDATDGRRVRAAVVVDHDDHRPVGRRDVVEGLPAHPAGERAVADDGDHRTALAAHRVGLGQPVGVGQCRGRVRVLDPVVRRSRPGSDSRTARRPAAGSASAGARPVRILWT